MHYVYLNEPVMARFIKFHTVTWHQHPSMRVEIIGCQGARLCSILLPPPPWNLPNTTHSDLTHMLSDDLPIYDEFSAVYL